MLDDIARRFRGQAPCADFVSLRVVRERSEALTVRRGVLQPVQSGDDLGAMITVVQGGGVGYAGTSDVSDAGLREAAQRALAWARGTAGRTVVDFSRVVMPRPQGSYRTPVRTPWTSVPLAERIDLVRAECARLAIDPRIVDWQASLWNIEVDTLYVTVDGARVDQHLSLVVPNLSATANEGTETQVRSLAGRGICRQGGLEVLDATGFHTQAPRIAREALELLEAPNCPSGKMFLLLAADQMYLQIHESIGHPLELDRILGDERNYAGTSFVTPEMFGTYRYGSRLLNVTFDPAVPGEFASYGFDDDGVKAERTHIIRDGVLLRPLGSAISQARAGLDGVANSRASSWNRAPIDRMANLNVEPGDASIDDLVAMVDHGVLMSSNCSWSIDDSRNKFQFGCEWGRLIDNGVLGAVVKKPNYRGISATFWRNLVRVGNGETRDVLGSPFCGKGEPNQIIRVGHASPACLFADVDVFGGE